jgi:hypothetical protein
MRTRARGQDLTVPASIGSFARGGTMRTTIFLATALLCGGCSSTPASNMDGGVDMRRGPEVCMPDGQSVTLGGQYGVQATLNVNVKVTPGCSGASCIVDQDTTAELLLLATVTQTGSTATVTARPCKITVPPVALKNQPKPVQLTVPTALVKSVKTVTSNGTLSSTMTCANFDATPITLVLGAHLASPTDPLPQFVAGGGTNFCGGSVTTACDPTPAMTGCVCDQEATATTAGDGKPGATVQAMNVPGGDYDLIYVDLRTSVTLTGQVFPQAAQQVNPGQRIKGKVANLALDTSVLGCHSMSTGECGDADTGTVAALQPAVTQSANADSTFIAVPLTSGDTCDSLIANEATLFQ